MATFGSAFAGIGGFELGLERAGWECKWQVEIDDFCLRVLEKHWPDVPKYRDIREIKGLPYVDLICGGFPCPAFSQAGLRGGFEQDDLFWEMIRICDEVKPIYILAENVRGFTHWREQAVKEFQNIGYHVWDGLLDARCFGIPQCRVRWFAICVREGSLPRSRWFQGHGGGNPKDLQGVQLYLAERRGRWTPSICTDEEWLALYYSTTRSRIGYGIPNRVDRLRSLGNAVVPQMAEWIGRRILEYELAGDRALDDGR